MSTAAKVLMGFVIVAGLGFMYLAAYTLAIHEAKQRRYEARLALLEGVRDAHHYEALQAMLEDVENPDEYQRTLRDVLATAGQNWEGYRAMEQRLEQEVADAQTDLMRATVGWDYTWYNVNVQGPQAGGEWVATAMADPATIARLQAGQTGSWFTAMDADGDGIVREGEFLDAQFGATAQELPEAARNRFQSIDTAQQVGNSNGVLEPAEMLAAGLGPFVLPMDADGDGQVTEPEFLDYYVTRRAERFDRFDANNDGAIDEGEAQSVVVLHAFMDDHPQAQRTVYLGQFEVLEAAGDVVLTPIWSTLLSPQANYVEAGTWRLRTMVPVSYSSRLDRLAIDWALATDSRAEVQFELGQQQEALGLAEQNLAQREQGVADYLDRLAYEESLRNTALAERDRIERELAGVRAELQALIEENRLLAERIEQLERAGTSSVATTP